MNGKTFNERIIIIILEIFLEFYSISIYDIISTVNSMNRIFFSETYRVVVSYGKKIVLSFQEHCIHNIPK